LKPVALVTGSTSGIGKAIAQRMYAEGYLVALHSRASVEAGLALTAEMPGCGYLQADLGDQNAPAQLIREVIDHFGRLDVLVNNAGISKTIDHKDLRAASADVWREQYEVNVIAPWLLITAAEPHLRRAGENGKPACIVNISTHAATRPKGASIPYACSKAALNHMTLLLARSLAPGIRVNAVSPGLVDTPMSADWHASKRLWSTRAPMQRVAQPDEIAQVVWMLISSDYLTGENIIADGGLNLT
jgi:NAD(P)-dependent dehydrogenase (short-subunit alcohol dehydrogenase family)